MLAIFWIRTIMTKISIRFFNDREVRAIWDEVNSKWWFSAIDIVRAINKEDDYVKAGNYWRWLKKKLNYNEGKAAEFIRRMEEGNV